MSNPFFPSFNPEPFNPELNRVLPYPLDLGSKGSGNFKPVNSPSDKVGGKVFSSKDKEFLYSVTDGKTEKFYQPDYKKKVDEKVIEDKQEAFTEYPFNIESFSPTVKDVRFKLENTTLRISKNGLSANNSIYIELRDSSLYVWTTETRENRKLTTKGDSVLDGYSILDFEGLSKKVAKSFEIKQWNTASFEINKFEFNGKNCKIIIDDCVFSEDVEIKLFGENSFDIRQKKINRLNLFSTYNDINFFGMKSDILLIELEGNGKIFGLEAVNEAMLKLVGDGQITVKKNENTIISEEINGTGTIKTIS